MTKKDVSTYLEKKGVPIAYCKVLEGMQSIYSSYWHCQIFISFIENYVDGCAFMMLSESNVRELVPPIGLIKKIMSFIPRVSCHDMNHVTMLTQALMFFSRVHG